MPTKKDSNFVHNFNIADTSDIVLMEKEKLSDTSIVENQVMDTIENNIYNKNIKIKIIENEISTGENLEQVLAKKKDQEKNKNKNIFDN